MAGEAATDAVTGNGTTDAVEDHEEELSPHGDEPVEGDEPVDDVPVEEDVRTIVERDPSSVAVVPLVTAEAAALIRTTLNPDLTDAELMLFAAVCNRVGLDPFARQIYAVKRNDNKAPGGKRVTFQTGIDGFRLIARRTGRMAGRLGPYFCGDDGEWLRDQNGEPKPWLSSEPPVAAMVGVVRHGDVVPTWAVARWKEFVPPSGQDQMWIKMPTVMLGKCAEAQSTRAAFPAETSGLYVDEEMAQSAALPITTTSEESPPMSVADPDTFRELLTRIGALPEDARDALKALWAERDEIGNPRLPPLARLLARHANKARAMVQSIEKRVEKGEWGPDARAAWEAATVDPANQGGDVPDSTQETPGGPDAPTATDPAPDAPAAPGTSAPVEERRSWSSDVELMQICVDEVRKMSATDVVLAVQDRPDLDQGGNVQYKRRTLAGALYADRGGAPTSGPSVPPAAHETPTAPEVLTLDGTSDGDEPTT